uniref:NAD(P)-binding protein n=1 Tax=Mycena chlorophos TaxID=658473 RepID=A0ABQ0LLH4_MYCCL|nr:predicted protein [Mycena chlorophos]
MIINSRDRVFKRTSPSPFEVAEALKEQIAGKNRSREEITDSPDYRNNDKGLKISEDTLKDEFPSANIRPLVLDLSSSASVRQAAATVNAYPVSERLHVLVHNAAATAGVYTITDEGIELQLATAHVGPFLFTKLLAPNLLSTHTSTLIPRVVFVSSRAHAQLGEAAIDLAHFRMEPADANTPIGQNQRYGEVKAANVLMAVELSRRAKASSTHIVFILAMGMLSGDGKPQENMFAKWKTLAQGAATTVAAAFDPRLNDKPGAYLVDGTGERFGRAVRRTR